MIIIIYIYFRASVETSFSLCLRYLISLLLFFFFKLLCYLILYEILGHNFGEESCCTCYIILSDGSSLFCFSSHDELMLSPIHFATRGLFMPEQKNSLIVQEIS